VEAHSGKSEKSERFAVPGLGTVKFLFRHQCRSLRAANEKKKAYETNNYVRVEREGNYYRVYTRRK
jgi:hypothetical protein